MNATRSLRLQVTGKVQGVGYRLWAERTAQSLGLRGWVRNRADGSVELLVTGSESAAAALIDACRRGPRLAEVTGVEVAEAADDGSAGFTARPSA
jgi:acylphosphatase